MRVLILHGPNMNLFGIRSSKKGENITLDKINRYIRQYIKNKNLDIKIIFGHPLILDKFTQIISYAIRKNT